MKEFWARQTMMWTVTLSLLVFLLNGCVYLVVGGVGALGVYVVSPDTVEGTVVDRSYDTVWDTSVKVLSQAGMLEERNEIGGVLTARVLGSRVQVTLFRVGGDAVKLSVKARRAVFPKIKTAQDVYVKIVSALDVNEWDEQG